MTQRKRTPPAGGVLLELPKHPSYSNSLNAPQSAPAQAKTRGESRAPSRRQRSLPRSAFPRRRLQGLARELHRLGPKTLFHYLDEVERGAPVAATLESFLALLSPIDGEDAP